MAEPYRYNSHAPSHVNQQAREEAKRRGEDTTREDAKQTQHEEGAPAAGNQRPAE